MRKLCLILILLIVCGFIAASVQGVSAAPSQDQAQEQTPTIQAKPPYSYNPAGRRDPFKNLLGGREVKELTAAGEAQITVEDLVLIGIVKGKIGYTAIFSLSHGFPFFVNVGYKFVDGYVLSIEPSRVTIRKTHDRGIPLVRPRDIIKEITPEER